MLRQPRPDDVVCRGHWVCVTRSIQLLSQGTEGNCWLTIAAEAGHAGLTKGKIMLAVRTTHRRMSLLQLVKSPRSEVNMLFPNASGTLANQRATVQLD